jgi:hypothetical protein
MILKPQDVVVLLKLVALGDAGWTYQRLATELSLSASEAHAGVRRAVSARLMTDANSATDRPCPRVVVLAGILPRLSVFTQTAYGGLFDLRVSLGRSQPMPDAGTFRRFYDPDLIFFKEEAILY